MEIAPWHTAYAPAKLNLFLHITGQREDGYHTLQSLMVRIGLFDVLHFRYRSDGVVRLLNPTACEDPNDDLVVKAARALQVYINTLQQGVDILLEKRIPMGGGLGGGSSDAATVLMALNRLWNAGLSDDLLAKIGIKLGADIPFFILGGRSAWIEGIGERVIPMPCRLPVAYCVMHPPVHVSTKEVFQSPDLRREDPTQRISSFSELTPYLGGDNAMEATARRLFSELDAYARAFAAWVKEEMGWTPPRMTGSGSCFFVPLYEAEWADGAGAAGALDRARHYFRYRTDLSIPDIWFIPQT